MTNNIFLPPGQKLLDHFPRYGLWQYATRIESVPFLSVKLRSYDQDGPTLNVEHFNKLPRHDQVSDFHCVTTWSKKGLNWSGYQFKDFYEQIAKPELKLRHQPKVARFSSEDGYETFMYLEDLLADDVLLADRLDGHPLGLDHGGPLRLVAPAHYGFKSAKHICEIRFCEDLKGYHSPWFHWHEHPRARVALEERGRFLPSPFWRWIGPPAIPTVLYAFRRAARKRARKK